jgi:WD40 repeat protein
MKLQSLLTVGLITVLLASQATADETTVADDTAREATFEKDVLPMLQANCIACHNRTVAESDLILESPETMLAGGASGAAIDLETPEDSLLLQLAAQSEEPVMPPVDNDVRARRLTDAQLNTIQQWIAGGAKRADPATLVSLSWSPISPALVAVYALDLDWHGRFLAAGRGGRITVYDRAVPEQQYVLADTSLNYLASPGAPGVAHRDFVQAVAFHPQKNLLASAGYQVVKIWSLQLPDDVRSLPSSVADHNMKLLQNGSLLLVNNDGGFSVSSSDTEPVSEFVSIPDMHVTAGSMLPADDNTVICGTRKGDILAINTADYSVIAQINTASSPIKQIACLIDSADIAVLGEDGHLSVLKLGDDNKLTLTSETTLENCASVHWTKDAVVVLCNGNQLKRVEPASCQVVQEVAVDEQIIHIAASPVTDRVVIVTESNKCQVLSGNGNDLKTIVTLSPDVLRQKAVTQAEHMDKVVTARVAHVKSLVDARQKEVASQKTVVTKAKEAHATAVTELEKSKEALSTAEEATVAAKKALEASPEDAALKKALETTTKAEETARTANTASLKKERLQLQDAELAQQAVDRFEAAVVELQADFKLAETNAADTAASLKSLQEATAESATIAGLGFLNHGTTIVTCDADGDLRRYLAADGMPLDSMVAESGEATVTGFQTGGHDDALMALSDGTVVVRSCQPEWKLVSRLQLNESGELLFPNRVNSLAFSPDGQLLAAGGGEASRSGSIAVWNTSDFSLKQQFTDVHSDVVYGLDFSADGQFLASASADKFARVFDLSTGTSIRTLEGHTNQVMDISWNAAQSTIATAGADNTIKIWNADTGLQQRTISTYGKQVSSIQFTDTTTSLLSSSGDKRIILHNASNGKAIREMPRNPDYVHRAVASGSGSIIAAGCEDGHVRVWTAADGKELANLQPDTNQDP